MSTRNSFIRLVFILAISFVACQYMTAQTFTLQYSEGVNTITVNVTQGKKCVVTNALTTDPTGKILASFQNVSECKSSEETTFIFTGIKKDWISIEGTKVLRK